MSEQTGSGENRDLGFFNVFEILNPVIRSVPDENEVSGFRHEGGVPLGVLALAGDEVLFDRLALVPDPE